MSVNFWQKKTKFRKSIMLKNVIVLVVETMIEDNIAKNESEAISRLIEEPKLYDEILQKLSDDYEDIQNT